MLLAITPLCSQYGRIRDISIKSPGGAPAFAFVEFEDQRDADDAVHGRDGYEFDRQRIRVEIAGASRGGGGGGGGGGDRYGGGGGGGKGGGGGGRFEWRVIVTGMPKSASWQDLKDFLRQTGDVVYTDVRPNGDGIGEYSREEDMQKCLRDLDDSEFRSRFDERQYVRVRAENEAMNRGRSRNRSRSRSPKKGSRSRSPEKKKSRSSRSRSRSPEKKKSRSRSRSPEKKKKSRSRSRSRSAKKSKSRSPSARKSRSRSRSRD